MLTIPSSIFKSYTKDLSLPIFELVLQRQTAHRQRFSGRRRSCHNGMIYDAPGGDAYSYS